MMVRFNLTFLLSLLLLSTTLCLPILLPRHTSIGLAILFFAIILAIFPLYRLILKAGIKVRSIEDWAVFISANLIFSGLTYLFDFNYPINGLILFILLYVYLFIRLVLKCNSEVNRA